MEDEWEKLRIRNLLPHLIYTHTKGNTGVFSWNACFHPCVQCTFYVLLVYCDTLHSNICIHCTEFLYCWNPWIKKKRKTIDHGILVSYLRYTYKHVQYKHNFIVLTLPKIKFTKLVNFQFYFPLSRYRYKTNYENSDICIYLKQWVIEVFCSTSTERSKKSSSLLLICRRKEPIDYS